MKVFAYVFVVGAWLFSSKVLYVKVLLDVSYVLQLRHFIAPLLRVPDEYKVFK